MNDIGDDLFRYLRLPEGIDKDTLTGNILLRGGEFEVVYSDPEFIQRSISIWSSKWYRTFEKWINALNIDYNPLENYDRMEEWTDNRNKKDSSNDSGKVDNTQDTTGGTTYNEQVDDKTSEVVSGNEHLTSTVETENKVSAFDSDEYQPHDKTISDTTNDTTSDSERDTQTDHDTTGNTSENNHVTGNVTSIGSHNGTEDEDSRHVGRVHGNIGVTTSQQMLESELQLAEWNIYEHITDIFLSEYVIPIYS